jgi:IclR family transcriptional regulator, blcABC operon repressor
MLNTSQNPVGSMRDVRSPAPAVTRAAALLKLLSQPGIGTLGVSELARQLDLPKSSIANLCNALEEVHFVRRINDGYTLGHYVLELGSAYLNTTDLPQDFRERANGLPTASEETVLLAMLDGNDIVYLARHDGTQPIRLASDIGRRLPAACTALGKAMLSQQDLAEVRARYKRMKNFPVMTPKSNQNVDELIEDLERSRERGYAIDDEENMLGVKCFAVALGGVEEEPGVAHAVSTTMLKARASSELEKAVVTDLTQLATDLTPWQSREKAVAAVA